MLAMTPPAASSAKLSRTLPSFASSSLFVPAVRPGSLSRLGVLPSSAAFPTRVSLRATATLPPNPDSARPPVRYARIAPSFSSSPSRSISRSRAVRHRQRRFAPRPSHKVPPHVRHPPLASVSTPADICDDTRYTGGAWWRLAVMGDGHAATLLRMVTNGAARLVVSEHAVPDFDPPPPPGHPLRATLCALPNTRARLQTRWENERGEVLMHATSWWDAELRDRLVCEAGGDARKWEERSLWETLQLQHVAVARRVVSAEYGESVEFERICGKSGPFWCRHQVFRTKGRTLVVLCEMWSPALEQYAGPMLRPVRRS